MRVLFVFFCRPETPFQTSIAALSAVAREAGHETRALSIPLETPPDAAARRVLGEPHDLLAITAMSRDWPLARALIASTESRYVVVGGYHASLAPRAVAKTEGIDAICIGEGERPFRALLEGRPRASIPGLWVRGFAEPVPAADPEPDIAALPRWDYEVFGDVGAMLDRGINTYGPLADRFLPTRASRGCPYRCAYCSAPRWGALNTQASTRNVRPVAHLCDELADLRERYAPAGFEFWDEHFPIDLGWLRELARVYPERVGLPFKVEMHPSAATRERLEALAAAGCVLFHCGVESGDADLRLRTLERRTSDRVLERVFRDARELGLQTSASVMTALPGETLAQAMGTVSLLRSLAPGSFMWSTYAALPSTPLGDAPRPDAMTDTERERVYAELRALQSELVGRARSRPGDRERPVAIPEERPQRAPRELAALIAPAADVLSARWLGNVLLVEIARDDLRPSAIEIARAGTTPCYRQTPALSLSYRGEASPALLRAVDDIALRLGATGLDDLRRLVPA